jgi:CRP-like cAMP-binding protein
MSNYFDKIDAYIQQLDTESLMALARISTKKTFKKGDFLLRQNQNCSNSYLIEEGVVRKFYLNDGKEITTELLFENDIAISFQSYTLQQPCREMLQALTDVNVSATDYEAFQKAKKNYPKLVVLDLMMTEYYTIWLEERLFQFHTLSATDRYLMLIKEHPHFIQHVSLTHIASYLGISLETLSRIRAKL